MIDVKRASKTISLLILTTICLASFALMRQTSLQEPEIVDESAHIPAGYSYARYLDYRLNPEHPPLVKALAALPLLILQPHFPLENPSWTTDVNGQWGVGEAFVYQSGNNADEIVQVARIMPMLITILLIILIYIWSAELVGRAWALLPAFLFAFSPTVLAHGHYVTTDVGAAFGILLASYFFVRYLRLPSPRNILLAGLALGIAQLLKFSAVLLIPYAMILAAVHFFVHARDLYGTYFWRMALRRAGELLLVFVIAMLLIYAVYALFVWNYPMDRQVADSQTILSEFIPGGISDITTSVTIWMAKHAITRPLAEYFLGVLMVIRRATGGNTAYFLGEVSNSGSHWYFPVVYLLKEPIATLGFLLIGLLLALKKIIQRIVRKEALSAGMNYLREHFAEFALLLFSLIYWGYTIKSNLNIGVRHLLPVLPLMYILAACAWCEWFARKPQNGNLLKYLVGAWLKFSLLFLLLVGLLFEVFGTRPYFLSYFNQIAGGTENGYRYVTDSNYDWGQDLLRLRSFVNAHPEIDKIGVDYFGTAGAVEYYLGNRATNWWSAKGNPSEEGTHWLAVSINVLQSAIQPLAPGFGRAPADEYAWLTDLRPAPAGTGQVPEPDYRIGTTIWVYKL